MVNVSLRGIDENVREILKERARKSGLSINALILDYINKGVGIDPGKRRKHHDLDRLAGTWSASDREEFAAATSIFEEIDENIWK